MLSAAILCYGEVDLIARGRPIMTLDVPSEYEDVLRQAVASGAFADEQAVLRYALELLAKQQAEADMIRLPESTDIEALAMQQGIKPFRADDPAPSNIWPEDETTSEFLSFLRESRSEESNSGATH